MEERGGVRGPRGGVDDGLTSRPQRVVRRWRIVSSSPWLAAGVATHSGVGLVRGSFVRASGGRGQVSEWCGVVCVGGRTKAAQRRSSWIEVP